jgi:uncharacterized protein
MSREPSMEEILSSIRRVIARDEATRDDAIEARFGDAANSAPEEGDDSQDGDDILDLTEVEGEAAMAVETSEAVETELISPVSANAARHSMDQLAAVLGKGAEPTVATSNAMPGMTIEALAEAALKPMLKEWLDTNLPPMVERLVAREIARITGGRL